MSYAIAKSLIISVTMLTGGCAAITTVPLQNGSSEPMQSTEFYPLPKTMIGLEINGDSPESVGIGVFTVPDSEHFYAININENILSQEVFKFENGDGGLLKSLNSTLTDKTTDVVKAAAGSLGRLGGGSELSAGGGKKAEPIFAANFDPHSAAGMTLARRALSAKNMDIVCLDCRPPTPVITQPVNGIISRPKMQIRLMICKGSCATSTNFVTRSVGSFNGSPLTVIPVKRSAFGERKTTVTFAKDGLVKSEVTKPSEAVGLFKLPGEAIGSLVEGITKGFQDDKAVIDAEKALIDSQIALIEAETKKLEAAKKARATNDALPVEAEFGAQ